MSKPTFSTPDLSFCLLDSLGLRVTGQQIRRDRAILECRVTEDDPWYRDCGAEGVAAGHGSPEAGPSAVGVAARHPVGQSPP